MSRDYMKRGEWRRFLSQAQRDGYRRMRRTVKVAAIAYVVLGIGTIMSLSIWTDPSLAGVFLGLFLVGLIMIVPALQYGILGWFSLRIIHKLAEGDPDQAHVYLKVAARDDQWMVSRGLWVVTLPANRVSNDDFETAVTLSDGVHRIRKLDS